MVSDGLRELTFLLRPGIRRDFAARLSAASGDPSALFGFAGGLGLYQIESEILGLMDLAAAREPATACELGTWRGGTNFLLGELLPSLRLLIGVDVMVQNRLRLRRATRPGLDRRLLSGSTGSPRVVRRVRELLAGTGGLDLLFIDAGHHYQAVSGDFEQYRHLTRDGGLIVFHDIVPDYRGRYGLKTGPWSGGVPDFWREIKDSYRHWEIIESDTQNAFGIGIVEYRAARS